jgi:phytoene synthase
VTDAATCRAIVRRSGTSFRWGIASVAGDQRRAMHALYAFCRLVDDAADSAAPPAARLRFIDAWREEVGRFASEPGTPVGRELAWACARFRLPTAELDLLLDGMAADAVDRVRLPDEAALDAYCRAVAGTVGRLAVRIFGAPRADAFALRLGHALQLVNVLRDVEEDATRDRVYVPTAWLAAEGIADGPAAAIVGDRRFGQVWTRLADEAERAFAAAEAALDGLERPPLRPALLMHAAYRWKLNALRRRGWQPGVPPPRLGPLARVQLAAVLLRSPT